MSLAVAEQAYGTFLADVIEHVAGQTRPDRILRYPVTLPDDCCSDAGTLAISHELIQGSDQFPTAWAGRGAKASGWQLVKLKARLAICWTVPARSPEGGVIVADPEWDAKAARLALIQDTVNEALICTGAGASGIASFSPTPKASASAFLAYLNCDQFRWIDCQPTAPLGGCVAMTWRAWAGLADTPAS